MKKNNNGIYILISTIIFCVFGYYVTNNILVHLASRENIIKVEVDDQGIAAGVENVFDSVVSISVNDGDNSQPVGSGFVFSEDGYILTNYHVVKNNSKFGVILSDGSNVSAEFVGSDEYFDIAVLKIKSSDVKKVAVIGNSDETRVGDTIFTVGTPVDIRYAGTVTRGIISSKNRLLETSVNSETLDWIMEVIQIDAAINNGNSGGPLCNVNGEVIGINTLKVSSGNVESIAFAIPIETAIKYANVLVSGDKIERPMLGIRMANVQKSSYLSYYGISLDPSITSGVVVVESLEGGPGEKAGLKKGDVISKIGEVNISNIAQFNYNLFNYKKGDKVTFEIIRNNEKIKVEVVLVNKEN